MGLFGNNNADTTGYNCQQINDLRGEINDIAQKSGTNIVERLHDEIIVPMSTVWYAPEAKEFFEGLATTVRATGEGITKAFDTFRAAVQAAGEEWAENTGGERPSLSPIDNVELALNVSDIQESNAGNVTIDGTQASTIASRLTEVQENIKSDLQSLAAKLSAESAFIGQGQASAVEQCFVTVSGEIYKIFSYLTEGEDSLQGQINKAVKKYQDVSGNITGAFTNVN